MNILQQPIFIMKVSELETELERLRAQLAYVKGAYNAILQNVQK